MKLTSAKIESYVGDILPLKLICERDISRENIVWGVEGDAVTLREFSSDDKMPFRDGVLVSAISKKRQVETCRFFCEETIKKIFSQF